MARRTFLTEGVRYDVAGTTLHLSVSHIIQHHLATGGWSSSATLHVDDGSADTSMSLGSSSEQRSTTQSWHGYRFTVFAIHHTGGLEIAITRARGH